MFIFVTAKMTSLNNLILWMHLIFLLFVFGSHIKYMYDIVHNN